MATPALGCAPEWRFEAVGPPPAPIRDEPREVPPFPTSPPVGVEAQEYPPGAQQEFLEVVLEYLEALQIIEEVSAGGSVARDAEEDAFLVRAPANLELLPVAAERPDFLVHARNIGRMAARYEPVRATDRAQPVVGSYSFDCTELHPANADARTACTLQPSLRNRHEERRS